MSDDLVKRLRDAAMKRDGFDAVYLSSVAADRIEELEAKLAKAVEILKAVKVAPIILAELEGENND
jgi:hypothetical protein